MKLVSGNPDGIKWVDIYTYAVAHEIRGEEWELFEYSMIHLDAILREKKDDN